MTENSIVQREGSETQRLFVALPMPPHIVEQVSEFISGLRQGFKFINFPMTWTQPGALHLTLKFLGDVEIGRIREISQKVGQITARFSSQRLKIHEIGVFPNWKRPRVLWLGIGSVGSELQDIQSEIWRELDRYSSKPEKNHFRPHLTIGRFKSFAGLDSAKNIIISHRRYKSDHFTVGEIILYRSELKSSGAVHVAIGKFPLGVREYPTKNPENIG